MHPTDLLPSVPPLLSCQLKRRTDELQSKIIRANHHTLFAQTASNLLEFRAATTGLIDGMDDNLLSKTFRKTVDFTTYDSYAPFIARFFEKPCKAKAVADLLAPGLPDYLVKSTSTSGGLPKVFPKYDRLSKIKSSSDALCTDVDSPRRKRTRAYLSQFGWDPMHVENEDSCAVKTVYVTGISVVNRRAALNFLHPEDDKGRMATFILDHAAPFAAGFINKWRSYLLIHAIFAVGSRSLETMTISYTSTFVDMIRYLDVEFDLVVDCVESGTIPDLEGAAEVRHHLEVNISPNPERAAELRSLGRPASRQGWCGYAWPGLRSITTTASGSFASYLPLARWFLGPNVVIHSRGYRSTEAVIALPHSNPVELNKYKLDSESVIEFLDIRKSDLIGDLAQVWEVELGKRYEVVLTTQDGLWRYRLGDIVEISGFDPTDGVPIIQFIERRNVAMRFMLFMVTEEELRSAMLSIAASILVQITGWTTTIDCRDIPNTIGFFIELAGDAAASAEMQSAMKHILDNLSQSNARIASAVEFGAFRDPTIRLVQPGTFSEFLQLKMDEGGIYNNIAQLKVPVVLPKAEHVTWFTNRVVREL